MRIIYSIQDIRDICLPIGTLFSFDGYIYRIIEQHFDDIYQDDEYLAIREEMVIETNRGTVLLC